MRRSMILVMVGCVIAAVLLPTALQANEPNQGGKKPKLPAACADAFSSAEDAFASFDEVFGTPGDQEDLGILGDFIDAVNAGDSGDVELDDLSDAANDGQSSEIDFFDSLDTCLSKVRT